MKPFFVNPFTDPSIVSGYEVWYESAGRRADCLEKKILKQQLATFPGVCRVLELGCGTCHFTRWLQEQGFQTVGLDVSPLMLAEAVRLESPECVLGNGLWLPFANGSFDLTVVITSLEFVENPVQVLREVTRVSKQGMILGALNRRSLLGWRLSRSDAPIWQVANLFTPAELCRLVREAGGARTAKIIWRTTLWPCWHGALLLPWGGFISMAVRIS